MCIRGYVYLLYEIDVSFSQTKEEFYVILGNRGRLWSLRTPGVRRRILKAENNRRTMRICRTELCGVLKVRERKMICPLKKATGEKRRTGTGTASGWGRSEWEWERGRKRVRCGGWGWRRSGGDDAVYWGWGCH